MTAEEVKVLLNLRPHQSEGGFFVETYRSEYSTAVYYLLTPNTFSALHRLPYDEVYHFYLGDPVELLMLPSTGRGRLVEIGTDLESGMVPQVVVPKGTWQGSRLKDGGKFALMGTTMAPGFDPKSFELAKKGRLTKEYPEFRELISQLCRPQ